MKHTKAGQGEMQIPEKGIGQSQGYWNTKATERCYRGCETQCHGSFGFGLVF